MKSLTKDDIQQLNNSNRSIELIQRQYEFLVHGASIQKEIRVAKKRESQADFLFSQYGP